MGPNIDPWGSLDVPDLTCHYLVRVWVLPIGKDEIHFRVVSCTPCILSLYNNLRWLTLSKYSLIVKALC